MAKRMDGKACIFICASFIIAISMANPAHAERLPIVGGDNDTWGTILNGFLNVSLNETGFLRPESAITAISGTYYNISQSNANYVNFTGYAPGNWNTAFGWGNHALAGYLTSETNWNANYSNGYNKTAWDTAYAYATNGTYLLKTGDTATGNYTFDSGTLFVDSTNHRVGIGTTIPSSALSINGTGYYSSLVSVERSSNDTAGPWIVVQKSRNGGSAIANDYIGRFGFFVINSLGSPFAAATLTAQADNVTAGSEGARFNFETSTGGVKDVTMSLLGNGNVGIGTTLPQNKLNIIGDINATSNISTPKICLNGNCQTAWPSGSDSSGWNITGTTVQLITSSNNVSANTLFVDNAQGRVGIGTTTPLAQLDVLTSDKITNGNFNTNISGWTDYSGSQSNVTWNPAGKADINNGNSSYWAIMGQSIATVAGLSYSITYTTSGTPSNEILRVGSTLHGVDLLSSTMGRISGAYTEFFTAAGATTYIEFADGLGGTITTMDNIAVYPSAINTNGAVYLTGGLRANVSVFPSSYIDAGYFTNSISLSSRALATSSGFGYDPTTYKVAILGSTGATSATSDTISMGVDPTTVTGGSFSGTGVEILFRRQAKFMQANDAGTDWWPTLTLFNNRVGIGTTGPSYALSFYGDSTQFIGVQRSTGTTGAALRVLAGAAKAATTNSSGGDLYLESGIATGTGSANIYFQTTNAGSSGTTDNNPATVMTILGNGNVGIGNTTPASTLLVSGTFSVMNASGTQGLYQDSNGSVGVGLTALNPVYKFDVKGNTHIGGDLYITTSQYIRFGSVATFGMYPSELAFGTANPGYNLAFYAGSATPRMYVNTTNGNVGINTTSPDQALKVQGNVNVTGAIKASDWTNVTITKSQVSDFGSPLYAETNWNANYTSGWTGNCTISLVTNITVVNGLITGCS